MTTNFRRRTHSRVVLAHHPVDPLRIHLPSTPPQLGGDAWTPVAGHLQRDPLNRVAQLHVAIRTRRLGVLEPVEAGRETRPNFTIRSMLNPRLRLHFFLGLPVDRGFPFNACSIRCSSMRCKHPFKKSISSACWPILRSNSAIRPSAQRRFPVPGNTLPGPWRNSRRQRCSTFAFTSNARATSPMETPCSSRRTAASLNSLVNSFSTIP